MFPLILVSHMDMLAVVGSRERIGPERSIRIEAVDQLARPQRTGDCGKLDGKAAAGA